MINLLSNMAQLISIFAQIPFEKQREVFADALESLCLMGIIMGCSDRKDFALICEINFEVTEKLVSEFQSKLKSETAACTQPHTTIDKVETEHLNKIWNMN